MPVICFYGLRTGIIREGDDIAARILAASRRADCGLPTDGDVLVIAESALATSEGALVRLDGVEPGERALAYAARFSMDPRVAEIVLRECDAVIGGVEGFLLCMKHGTLLPNAGIDLSNAPPGYAVLLPRDPNASAIRIRRRVKEEAGAETGVIVADSRTHAMRLGCAGVAIGCAGIPSVIDERGRRDLYGRELHVTQRAVADCIASAAELLMGEADEGIPAVLARGLGLPVTDVSGVAGIDASACLFMGVALHADPSPLHRE